MRPAPRRRRRRWSLVAIALAMLSSLPIAGTASASKGQTMTFDASGELINGTSQHRQAVIGDLKSLGVDTVRIFIPWRFYAPAFDSSQKPGGFDATNPAHYPQSEWARIDDAVVRARTAGMRVLLTPGLPMPDWASASGNSDIASPKPAEFEQFVTAVGRRYSGGFMGLPRVDLWGIGNELNIAIFILPHPSGRLYRELFLAGQRGLQASGHGGDTILIGETAPSSGRSGTDPIDFLRQVFCLNSSYQRVGNCAPIDADGWATHPYNPKDPPFDRTPFHNILAMGNIGRLTDALKKAARAGATTSRLPVYVTEFGTESVPDPTGVSQQGQAEYNAIAEFLAWRNPQIKAFNQYLMQDDSGGTFSFQSGLRFAGGAAKLAFDAFRTPLVARVFTRRVGRRGHRRMIKRVQIWGVVRPGSGPYSITVRRRSGGGGAGKVLRAITTDARGYFSFNTSFRRGRQYQLTTNLGGAPVAGPWVRSYRFR
jgi:hypothetical protein